MHDDLLCSIVNIFIFTNNFKMLNNALNDIQIRVYKI